MHKRKISVLGLGYVGLPVAVAFGKQAKVIGFDTNEKRLAELREGYDRTKEIEPEDLKRSNIEFTLDTQELAKADFHIVAVPTPVDKQKQPDLKIIERASELVGEALKGGDIVVYESTVYPGVTEDICVPILERISGLKNGKDFTVGYSPERINPGDKEHTFTKIVKVVSGQNQATLDVIAEVYESVVVAGVYRAASIKVAEAAKIIENTQRDLNVALMNELALIFDRMGIDTNSVLEAANSKWNFIKFKPGLVGGHCIGVDPYYLTHKAQKLGYDPQVILAGRRVNDSMGTYIGQKTVDLLTHAGHDVPQCTAIVLGLTFKANCSDLRNTKVIDVINELRSSGLTVQVCDPEANADEAVTIFGLPLIPLDQLKPAEAVVIAVGHKCFAELGVTGYQRILKQDHVLVDVQGVCDQVSFAEASIHLWRL